MAEINKIEDIKNIVKLSADEIFDYILKYDEQKNDIINALKFGKDKAKFFKVTSDLNAVKLNERGSAALKKDILENIAKDKDILTLKVSSIKANPGQPRKVFNEDKINELSDSIKTHGLLQPIVVTPNKDDNGYTLIAGERRLRAHKQGNIEEIKAIVLNVNELESRKLAIIENLHREDLNPIEEGISYLELQKQGGYSLRDMEDIVKKSKNYVAARVNLTKFDDDCIDFILKQGITNIAKMLKILETEATNHKMLLEKLSKNDLSNEEIEKFKVEKITKLPDEKIKDKKSSNSKEVNHDNFNEDEDFSKDKKEAQVEALSESIRSQDDTQDNIKDESNVIQETEAVKITGEKSKRINISIDVENMTGKDSELLKEFISSL